MKVRPGLPLHLSPAAHPIFDPGGHLRSPRWPRRVRRGVRLSLVKGLMRENFVADVRIMSPRRQCEESWL